MTAPDTQSFAQRLRQLREQAGLTQQQLAEKAGLHLMGIGKLEQGSREPTWETVRTLARALGTTCMAFDSPEPEATALPAVVAAEEPAKKKGKGRPKKEKD